MRTRGAEMNPDVAIQNLVLRDLGCQRGCLGECLLIGVVGGTGAPEYLEACTSADGGLDLLLPSQKPVAAQKCRVKENPAIGRPNHLGECLAVCFIAENEVPIFERDGS